MTAHDRRLLVYGPALVGLPRTESTGAMWIKPAIVRCIRAWVKLVIG